MSPFNPRFWGFLIGFPIFLLFVLLERLKQITVSPIDFQSGHIFWATCIGFVIGVLLLELPRFLILRLIKGEDKIDIFYGFFVMLVVASSLSALYVFVVVELIRAILVVGATGILIGIGLDALVRSPIFRRIRTPKEKEIRSNNW